MKYKNFDPKFRVLKQLYEDSTEDTIKVHSEDLMEMVNVYCKDVNKYSSTRSFNNDWSMYTMKIWGTERVRVNNIQKVGYKVSKDKILETARKIQRDPNFTFDDYLDVEMDVTDSPDMSVNRLD